MNITPIFIHTPHVPEKCPGCGKDEDTVLVCRNCGHEYVDEESPSGWSIFFLIVGIVLGIALLMIFLNWLFHIDTDEKFDRTFIQYLGDCLKYFWEKIVKRLF